MQKDKVEFAMYGILTPIKDVQKLREAIRLMISNSDIKAMYANKSLIRAREFDIETIITKYKDVICVE
jgi:N-acetylgalactosamine-N,N'-diacetylbacillosaminyl-diphospho-undecaprenol 4-alpha-N-acetylgalactosaminyltransferase